MTDVTFGTWAGKTSISARGTVVAQLANKLQSKPTNKFPLIPTPPKRSSVTGIRATIQNNPRGSGSTPVTAGASPVSHVTQDPIYLTPEIYSRGNNSFEGNITGNTTAKTFPKSQTIRVLPRFGLRRPANGDMEIAGLYRQDNPITQYAGTQDNGTGASVVAIAPGNDTTHVNPTVSQNQDTAPRLNIVKAFESNKGLVVVGVIVILFLLFRG